jgi:GntR family transcriptional regulator/MocR family aminotransferase
MFTLHNDSELPLYQQLYRQIRDHILTGKLPADSRLPSVRELAQELAASRNTVDGAYQELLAEGYIYSKERSGYFVSALEHNTAPPVPRQQPSRFKTPSSPTGPWRFDFHPARLDPASFPATLWRKCYTEGLHSCGEGLTEYGAPQGDAVLRHQLQQYLERSRGVLCTPEQIVVCAGLQQGLEIVAQLLRESHATLAVENPGYHLPRAVFAHHGYTIAPIPVTPQGLDVGKLRESRATLAYVTPSHQLPLGYVMPIAQRLQLLEWAEHGNNVILEDDYDSELRYHGRPIPSLQGLRPLGRVVYFGTFSKTVSPALRLGYLVLPPELLTNYQNRFAAYFSTVSLLEQLAMARFMAEGHWERHLRRMRTCYQKKHAAMLDAVARHFGSAAAVIGQGAGLHLVVELTGANPGESEILRHAAQNGIRLFPFSAFYAGAAPERTRLILGFGGANCDELAAGVARLASLCV